MVARTSILQPAFYASHTIGYKKDIGDNISPSGADKLFPKNVSVEMNVEEKLIAIQDLLLFVGKFSPGTGIVLTDFAEKGGFKNVGHMLHANQFGKFEERCAGGVYLAGIWEEWLRTFGDARNQLACFLRSVSNPTATCKFLWAGAALIGIHVR